LSLKTRLKARRTDRGSTREYVARVLSMETGANATVPRVEVSLIVGSERASICHNGLLYKREETIGVDVEKLSFER